MATSSHTPHIPDAATQDVEGTSPRSAHGTSCKEPVLDIPDDEILYDLADLFKIFSDTSRVKILFALCTQDLSVNDLAEGVGLSQSAVSHQLRTLKQTHLVKFRRDGKQLIYSLVDDHVKTMLSQGLTHMCE